MESRFIGWVLRDMRLHAVISNHEKTCPVMIHEVIDFGDEHMEKTIRELITAFEEWSGEKIKFLNERLD